MTIGSVLKTIQDMMRKDPGVDGDAQRLGQIVWLLFLKIFDDRESERENLEDGYVSPLPAKLRWRHWAQDPEGMTGEALLNFVNGVLFPGLKGLEVKGRNPEAKGMIQSVFSSSFNYMKSGQLLRQVINKINEVDFNNAKDRHQFGELYEELLRDLQSAGNAGEYYTPRAVVQFMVDRVNPKLGERIFDPACGTGGFLAAALEHVRSRQVKKPGDEKRLQDCIHGVEKKPLPHLLCVTNMILHDVDVPWRIRYDNTLRRTFGDYGPGDRVEVVITNPPFGGMEEDGTESNFPATYRTKETADLFLTLIMKKLLKDGGRGAIVLPDGTLFGEGVKTRIKEELLRECDLHTIVRMPNGVFAPYTGIRTNLLFFTKGKPTREIWYYEHPYPPGYKSYSKTKPIRIEEFAPEKTWWDHRVENEQAWKVDIKTIEARGFNLDIKNPNAKDDAHRDPEELLREYQDTRSAMNAVMEKLKAELASAIR